MFPSLPSSSSSTPRIAFARSFPSLTASTVYVPSLCACVFIPSRQLHIYDTRLRQPKHIHTLRSQNSVRAHQLNTYVVTVVVNVISLYHTNCCFENCSSVHVPCTSVCRGIVYICVLCIAQRARAVSPCVSMCTYSCFSHRIFSTVCSQCSDDGYECDGAS